MELEKLYVRAAREAARHRRHAADRPVAGTASREDAWEAFGGRLPDRPTPPGKVLDQLLEAADGHLVGTVGPRYFGFVIGGSTPAATAADMLAVGWDQNAFNPLMSPAAEAAERAAGGWVKDLLGLPDGASVGFVTGAQAANTVGIACGRHRVLDRAGWERVVHGLTRDGLAHRSDGSVRLGAATIDA